MMYFRFSFCGSEFLRNVDTAKAKSPISVAQNKRLNRYQVRESLVVEAEGVVVSVARGAGVDSDIFFSTSVFYWQWT